MRFGDGPRGEPARNEAICQLRREGLTLRAIGARFGIGPARVAQIVERGERLAAEGVREPLKGRAHTIVEGMLYNLAGRHRVPVTPERVAQIPAEVFNNDGKRHANFGKGCRRTVLEWLRRNGITEGPIFSPPEPIGPHLARTATMLRNLQDRAQNPEQAALLTEAVGLVERARSLTPENDP